MGNIVYASFIFGFICALIKPDRVYRVTQRDFVYTRQVLVSSQTTLW